MLPAGTWCIACSMQHWDVGSWTTEIITATRGWTWPGLSLPSSSEGESHTVHVDVYTGLPLRTALTIVLLPLCRLFRNLTKEVRMYASKFIDKGRVSECVCRMTLSVGLTHIMCTSSMLTGF